MRTRAIVQKALDEAVDKWRVRGAPMFKVLGRKEGMWRRVLKQAGRMGDVLSHRGDHLVKVTQNRGRDDRECICPALVEGLSKVVSKGVVWWQSTGADY